MFRWSLHLSIIIVVSEVSKSDMDVGTHTHTTHTQRERERERCTHTRTYPDPPWLVYCLRGRASAGSSLLWWLTRRGSGWVVLPAPASPWRKQRQSSSLFLRQMPWSSSRAWEMYVYVLYVYVYIYIIYYIYSSMVQHNIIEICPHHPHDVGSMSIVQWIVIQ